MRKQYPNLLAAGALTGPALAAWYVREYCRINGLTMTGHE